MKKRIILFVILIIMLILLTPIPLKLKDGGSIEYKALLYTVTKYHQISEKSETGYKDGVGIEILGIEIYNNLETGKNNTENIQEDIPDAIMVNGRIYYSTGEKSTITARCGNMDGQITSTVKKGSLPTKDNESNFGVEYGYQIISSDIVEVRVNNEFIVFKGEKRPFEIIFNKIENSKYEAVILAADETDKYSYNIYSQGGDIKIKIDSIEYDLRTALLENKITMEEIIEKANDDYTNKSIKGAMYKDGGSMLYQYETYSIMKYNRLDGVQDVYIGGTDMLYGLN